MKRILLCLLLISSATYTFGQLSLTPNQTATQLANTLVATSSTLGVVITNPILNCDSGANGLFSGSSNFGINNGIVLGNGNIETTGTAPNQMYGLNALPINFASTALNTPGDSLLSNLFSIATFDACVLELDIQPVGNFIEFEYVFGSEEYLEYNCTAFNDMFGFFISGPGFSPNTNIALLPNTSTVVSINSVNDGSGGNCAVSTSLYVTNNDTTNSMDGFTSPLIAHANVTPGLVYHLKMAIADASDMILNSYVLLKANSLKSGNTSPSSVSTTINSDKLIAYPTFLENNLFIEYEGNENLLATLVDLQGRMIKRWHVEKNANKTNVDVSDLKTGMYLLKIEDKNGVNYLNQRMIK